VSPWKKYWTQFRLPWDLMKLKLDVLFMPIQQIPYLVPRGIRTVAVVHDLAVHTYPEQFTYKDWLLLHVFSAYVARQADEIIAVSQATADDIKKHYGRSERVAVIHHGLDHDRFRRGAASEKEQAWSKIQAKYPGLRQPYILYVGQVQPRKNLIRLMEAFEQIAERDKELQLVVAGGHGWLKKKIEEKAARSKHKERIHMLGPVAEELLPGLYWNAEVFVLPSLYEGFGMPILEAMGSGCPVVTSDTSCMPEVAGGAAQLIDPLRAASIKEGIEQARRDRATLSEAGLRRAAMFDWDKTAAETAKIISNRQ